MSAGHQHAASLGLLSLGPLLGALNLLSAPLWVLAPLLMWAALSLQLVAAGYVANEPRLFGKRRDGTLALGPRLLLLPYHLLINGTRQLMLGLGKEPAYTEVSPGVFVGRPVDKLPPGVTRVLDLTAELEEPAPLRAHPGYLCVPTLDGLVPRPELLLETVADYGPDDVVYVHCAAGHGRSALAAAVVLAMRGVAADPRELVRTMQEKRPLVRLNPTQLEGLRETLSELRLPQRPSA